ncbi:winged helix-turn-helix domain-containing protein [Blastopirellula sp. JC732]|uniref:Winged helix-turn-helix domain-containing protein n=1 Tax=Blastopirellula sediminis TaxID=2894196 RepID=A0A9X1SG67_9BACT|nr:winged helix-turn-helix domain-containing protein [Blastopirellula sediminis]MCC9608576.1 winged helix-turn-helix domain-containing protein [Blastopirellula sediminis]MCC9628647.1 winged helix-turn-helix domain-containing protein [Blastopirellula sediminis]
MLTASKKKAIQESLQQLSLAQSSAVTQIEAIIATLLATLDLEPSGIAPRPSTPLPNANAARFSVTWDGKECSLGNTRLFWLFHRLASSANQYVTHEELLESVWHGERSESTVRGAVKRLRDQLAAAGMMDLAKAVDGTVTGYYGLIFV